MKLTECRAWSRLTELHAERATAPSSRTDDGAEGRPAFRVTAAGIDLDFSRQAVDEDVLEALGQLAEERDLRARVTALFSGASVNLTEGRAALHTALRSSSSAPLLVAGENIRPQIRASLEQMAAFVELLNSSTSAESAIRDVVSIGIGGSHLGPELIYEALKAEHAGPIRLHFVANVDPRALSRVLDPLDPLHTLCVITSKTFSTQETLANASAARDWYAGGGLKPEQIAERLVAISAQRAAALAFGIAPNRIFGFWDWVGGRYSLWSSVGLPVAIALGMGTFKRLLAGAEAMDRHFLESPWRDNLPVLLGLIGVWNVNVRGLDTLAVIPYSERLALFTPYLQQLDMESNGKRVDCSGEVLPHATGPVIWGTSGTPGQHAYFQHLHQSPQVTPVDLILPLLPARGDAIERQDLLVANCLAQAEALWQGQDEAATRSLLAARGLPEGELARLTPHRIFPGRRPVNLITLERLTPETLGALIALYEHKVYTQAVLWDINPFDQWGVELGKQIANTVVPELRAPSAAPIAIPALADIIGEYRRLRGEVAD
jgi:glucose-6-phosphate isomerase